jgi:hypothetical protein
MAHQVGKNARPSEGREDRVVHELPFMGTSGLVRNAHLEGNGLDRTAEVGQTFEQTLDSFAGVVVAEVVGSLYVTRLLCFKGGLWTMRGRPFCRSGWRKLCRLFMWRALCGCPLSHQ